MSKEQLSKVIDSLINDKQEQASTALHDYLTAKMQQVAGIKENFGGHDDKDMGELVDEFMDQEEVYSLEGERGVRNFEKLVSTLDSNYRDIREFLADNSGAIQAMVEWIQTQRNSEWQESLAAQLAPSHDGDDQEDDEDYR
jgi:predicted transcriptional regulator